MSYLRTALRRNARLLVAICVIPLLLVLAVVGSGWDTEFESEPSEASEDVQEDVSIEGDPTFAPFAIVGVIVAIGLLYLLLRHRVTKALAILLVALVAVALLGLWRFTLEEEAGDPPPEEEVLDTTLIPGAEEAEEPPWGLIIGLGAVGAVAFALVVTRSRRRGRGDVDVDDLAHEVQELADRLLDLAGSPRQNIIATYDHLEHLLASGGRSRDDAETTAEFSARVLTELGVSSGSCMQLAALYQAVAYGEREASEGDQVEASELLSAVSDDLVERSRRLAEAAQAASDRVGSDV